MTELQTLTYTILPAAKNVHPFFETNNVLGDIVTTSSSFPREEIKTFKSQTPVHSVVNYSGL